MVKVPIVLGGGGAIDLDLQGQILLNSQNLPHFELVHTITHYPFKLGSQNWDKMCKIACFRSLLFWVAIDLDLKSQIWLKKPNFLVSPLLEIHNDHITTRDPWVPRLLHRPECFMVSILYTYLYTWTVSRSRLFHSLDMLHVYWSRQPRVFWRLPSLLFTVIFMPSGLEGYFRTGPAGWAVATLCGMHISETAGWPKFSGIV